MCYNISSTTKSERDLEKRLGATYPKKIPQLAIRYSVSGFVHPALPIITSDNPQEFQANHWGLIPSWTANEELARKFAKNNLNARSETVLELKSFSGPARKQRCLIPITGFFEWRELDGNKYPYHIKLKNEEIFCLGGIYDRWVNKGTGEILNTISIVTTAANPLMAKIHNLKLRMPLILPRDTEKDWIAPDLSDSDIKSLMLPLDADLMEAHTISKRITSRKENPNSPETLLPFSYPEIEQAG